MNNESCHACGERILWPLLCIKVPIENSIYRNIYMPYCMDCYMELELGVIKNQNIHFLGGHRPPRCADNSPAQENAIRAMEDMQPI